MFGKIKDKLKGVFNRFEGVIEDEDEVKEEKPTKEKKETKKKDTSKPKKDDKKDKKEKPKKEKKKKDKEDKKKEKKDKKEPKEEVVEEPVEEVKEEKPKEKPKKEKKTTKKKEEKVEEIPEPEIESEKEDEPEEPEEKKAGFLSKVFGKKEEVEEEPTEEETKEPEVEDKTEEIVEESKEEAKDEEPEPEEEDKPKKGFLSKVFGKKEEEPEPEDDDEDGNLGPGELLDKEDEKDKEKKGLLSKITSKKLTESDFDKIWLDLEIFLLEINIAFDIVQSIEAKLREEIIGNSFSRLKLTEKIRQVLEEEVEKVLINREADFLKQIKEHLKEEKPVKVLMLGVNGTGKTTTIAKIVKYLRDNKITSVVAAADTFRAAAIEQLEEHSKKLDFKLIAHKHGNDPAAVAYDAIEHAKAKNVDVVLIDTAGRMPNNSNLMNELLKVKTVSKAEMAIFIGDSISGNDLIDQIELFNQGVEIDGAILTKVDTDEKPGSIVTTAYSVEKPIYFLGNGQTYDDLVIFDAKQIAKKLFEIEDE